MPPPRASPWAAEPAPAAWRYGRSAARLGLAVRAVRGGAGRPRPAVRTSGGPARSARPGRPVRPGRSAAWRSAVLRPVGGPSAGAGGTGREPPPAAGGAVREAPLRVAPGRRRSSHRVHSARPPVSYEPRGLRPCGASVMKKDQMPSGRRVVLRIAAVLGATTAVGLFGSDRASAPGGTAAARPSPPAARPPRRRPGGPPLPQAALRRAGRWPRRPRPGRASRRPRTASSR